MKDMGGRKEDTILVLDFGGQYSHLIRRRIREEGVQAELVPPDISPEEILSRQGVKGIVLSGGPSSIYEKDAPRCDRRILDLGIPLLGICYGHQLLAHYLGGRVERAKKREYGLTEVLIDRRAGILRGHGRVEKVWASHGDTVFSLPRELEVLAHTENCPVAAFRHRSKPIYGIQWHPEVTHTPKGKLLLRNFLFEVCGCRPTWTPQNFIEACIREIREKVGKGRCIIALSGGVDSSTAAVLAARAIGRRLTAVFVDHGFMRKGEPEEIARTFSRFKLSLICLNERKRFLEKLKGVTEPELKRKIIGEEFIRVFEEVAEKVKAEYLIQGTIYPDRIESGTRKHSEKIKTHHNVGGLPSKIRFKGIVEPLRDLYKDEVRRVARALGIPRQIVERQPFPGPGLAIRMVGEVTEEKLELLREADEIVREEIEREGLKPWQYFAVLLDTRSTGVKGDSRAYGYTLAVRAVESTDGMTASYAKLPHPLLERISTRITNELPAINRVVYDITHKPPATIEWE
ncbi:MAG: glutamine-hydrolyzing GMP synthase [Candidatus Hadarchaeales archaeon]